MKRLFPFILCIILIVSAVAITSCDEDNVLQEKDFNPSVSTSKESSADTTVNSSQSTTSATKITEATLANTEETTIVPEAYETSKAETADIETTEIFETAIETEPGKYTRVEYGSVSFFVPSDWESQTVLSVQTYISTDNNSNLTVQIQSTPTDPYANMTDDGFRTMIKPSLEAQGFVITNESVTHGTNANGLNITTIKYTNTVANTPMIQTLFSVFNNGEINAIAITQTTSNYDQELESEIYDSIMLTNAK